MRSQCRKLPCSKAAFPRSPGILSLPPCAAFTYCNSVQCNFVLPPSAHEKEKHLSLFLGLEVNMYEGIRNIIISWKTSDLPSSDRLAPLITGLTVVWKGARVSGSKSALNPSASLLLSPACCKGVSYFAWWNPTGQASLPPETERNKVSGQLPVRL